MTALILAVAVLAALCWLYVSPLRLAAAGGVLAVAHPVPTVALTALAVTAMTVAAAVSVYRTLRAEGWHLVTVQRPPLAPAGGVTA
ncbi:hypothetical protein [Actinomadura sp. 7K534]|uniref:hypothetical protein n=1 Tax=Actinomadura sp. 7K534 TaxID=2530366 RepID=UPI00105284AA|nr:hypothetical protein [Actinomadura sp. 7K534]TDB87053.1 hypothetical protein E1266_33320 [Actinomadura sp. 7K534]